MMEFSTEKTPSFGELAKEEAAARLERIKNHCPEKRCRWLSAQQANLKVAQDLVASAQSDVGLDGMKLWIEETSENSLVLPEVKTASPLCTPQYLIGLPLDASQNTINNLKDRTTRIGGTGSSRLEEILLSCCQRAFVAGKKAFLIKILETTLEKNTSQNRWFLRAKISQCLVRLYLEESEQEETHAKVLRCMDKALESLRNILDPAQNCEALAQWFSRVALNLAVGPSTTIDYIFDFFLRRCFFLEKIKGRPDCLRNALLLAVAAGLHVLQTADRHKEDAEKEDIIRKVLSIIEKCKFLVDESDPTVLCLLYLYEFEARLQMKESTGELFLKQMMQSIHMDAETLEVAAAIAYEWNPNNYKVIAEALKGAISKLMGYGKPDINHLSKLYHSLIQVLFFTQEYVASPVEEENRNVCKSLLKLLEDGTIKEYPQMEILWLMTKCWNWGMNKLVHDQNRCAQEWCFIALQFLQKLDMLKSVHEKKLQSLYSAYFPTSHLESETPQPGLKEDM